MIRVRPQCCICGASDEEASLAAEIHTGLPVCLDPFGCVARFIQVVRVMQDEADSHS